MTTLEQIKERLEKMKINDDRSGFQDPSVAYNDGFDQAISDIQAIIPEIIREAVEDTLTDYTNWLHKKGYIDSDYYTEQPTAVDAYLASLKETNK